MIESKYFDKSVSVDQATLITISNKYNTVMIGDFRQVYRSDYEIYTWGHCYIEKDSKGAEWGAFQNASIAGLMQEALSKKFSPATRFYVEAIS